MTFKKFLSICLRSRCSKHPHEFSVPYHPFLLDNHPKLTRKNNLVQFKDNKIRVIHKNEWKFIAGSVFSKYPKLLVVFRLRLSIQIHARRQAQAENRQEGEVEFRKSRTRDRSWTRIKHQRLFQPIIAGIWKLSPWRKRPRWALLRFLLTQRVHFECQDVIAF